MNIENYTELGLSAFSAHFAEFLKTKYNIDDEKHNMLLYAAALVSHAANSSHPACGLNKFFGQPVKATAAKLFYSPERKIQENDEESKEKNTGGDITFASKDEFENIAAENPNVILVIPPDENSSKALQPLIYDKENSLLYLNRYYQYQRELAENIKKLLKDNEIKPNCIFDSEKDSDNPQQNEKKFDNKQKEAIELALKKQFCIITGGPGRGKTTIAATICAKILKEKPDFKIKLCAPTGKAQARLKESVNSEKFFIDGSEQTDIEERVRAIPCSTVHALLGSRGSENPHFARCRENPIDVDMLIVDEVSMADLPLIAKLFDALPETARVILLGDKDQLTSVEAGFVLSDMIASDKIKNYIVKLEKNHRVNKNSLEISYICDKIADGKTDAADDIVKSGKEYISYAALPQTNKNSGLFEMISGYCSSLKEKIKSGEDWKIICAERNGYAGVENVNRLVRKAFGKRAEGVYDGLPVMILNNDRENNIFNGDIGTVKIKDTQTAVEFTNPERSVSLSQLQAYEDAYAMTIHKSQGSGYDNILVILPADINSPLLTRELIYTAISRAKKSVTVWAVSKNELEEAIRTQTSRASGLVKELNKN